MPVLSKFDMMCSSCCILLVSCHISASWICSWSQYYVCIDGVWPALEYRYRNEFSVFMSITINEMMFMLLFFVMWTLMMQLIWLLLFALKLNAAIWGQLLIVRRWHLGAYNQAGKTLCITCFDIIIWRMRMGLSSAWVNLVVAHLSNPRVRVVASRILGQKSLVEVAKWLMTSWPYLMLVLKIQIQLMVRE